MRRVKTAARLTLLLAVALTAAARHATAVAQQSSALSAAAAFTDCEGEACSQVTLTFDDTKQQYLAQNNSADRWVRVSASNVAAAASACLGPRATAYLPLKTVVGTYRAAYADVKCGAGPGT